MNKISDDVTRDLPEGTVTFLFTDIEGSTELLRKLGEEYMTLLADHHQILRTNFTKWNGREVGTEGDAFFVSFPRATDAIAAVVQAQRTFVDHAWPQGVTVRVRMGLHTGEPWTAQEGYVGMDVHRAARIAHVGHGGQVLLSETTAALVRDELPEGTRLLDLGRHRLKDIEQPEHIRQLMIQGLSSEYPPLKSLESIDAERPIIPNNLPVQSTPFIGRKEELADLEKLLADPDIRLVTIVGPGGVGKTRMILAAAERQFNHFEHGVFFVSLASLESVEDIVPAVARSLGFSFYKGDDHRQQLIDYLRSKSMLLLLDNFEHLKESASLVSELVQSAPGVRIIVTSREPLRLLDENLFSIDGFDVQEWATTEAALEYDAVQLFLNSAKRRRPEFDLSPDDLQPMTRICRLVQGMPLGIVLAAGWVELLSPVEIAEELGHGIEILETDLLDVPERQRSMQAVLDTTWEQLNHREREVLKRLSVFRGDCSQKAIRQVTGTTLMELKSLTGKSLINTSPDGRHEMHDLLRLYSAEKLENDPEASFEARRRHSSYFLCSIADREDDLFGPKVMQVMADIDSDLTNVRSALRWAAAHQQIELLDGAINPLFQYYYWRDRYNSMFTDAKIIVEGMDDVDSPEARLITARVLARQGWFLLDEVDLELVMKSEAILHRDDLVSLDTRKDKAFILCRLGNLIYSTEPRRGFEMSNESLVLFREVGDLWGEAAAINNLAQHANQSGDLVEEKRLRERCKFMYEQMGNPWDLARSLNQLATLEAHLGEVEEAERLVLKSYTTLKEVGDPSSIALSAHSLGRTLYQIGRFEEARVSLIDARERFEDLGHDTMMINSTTYLAWAYLHLGDYESAHSLAQQCLSYYEPHAIATWPRLLLLCLALVRKEPGEVHRQAQIILGIYRARHEWYSEMLCHSLTSMAERLRSNESGYRHYLIEALRITASSRDFGWVNPVWPAAALLFADRGDIERAVELYELACQRHYIAVSQWYEDIAGNHIFALAERLPPGVAEAARQRGRERDPVETAKELLAELESAATSKIAPPQSLVESLSERELELLQLVAEGKSNREIAQELILALGTVKSHLHNIFQKLGVRSRTQAVVRARELNLL